MEEILIRFLSLPNVVIYAILGAVSGVFGSVIGSLLSKAFKLKKTSRIVTIFCIFLAIQVPSHIVPKLQKHIAPAQVLIQLKEQRLFALIFRLHPEAEGEMKAKMKEVIDNSSSDQLYLRAQAASAELVAKYFTKHLVSASDEMTYKMLRRNVEVMKMFKNKPILCVGYYLGKPQFSKEDITNDFVTEQTNLKADIIESSVSNPSLPPKAANVDALIKIIAVVYQQKDYDLNDLAKIDQVGTLPPVEGCKIATEFSEALAFLDAKQSAYVFKNLIYLSMNQ